MSPHAIRLMQTAAVDVSVFSTVFAYGVFGVLLVLILRGARCGRRETLLFLGVFTWFVVATAVSFWWLGINRNPPDATSYWRWSASIVDSGFEASTIATVMLPLPGGLGVNSFVLFESIVGIVLPPRFEILTILNIFLATFAVFFAARTARMLFGARAQATTVVLFLLYFAMYWRCLHNLREAIILFTLGAWMLAFFRWRQTGRTTALIIAIIAATFAVVFRIENVILLVAFVSLYALVTARTALQFLPRALVIAMTTAFGVYAAFKVTGGDPFLAINWARKLRYEGGYSLQIPDVGSLYDVIWQTPLTLSFFLVPVLPWEIGVGLRYTLDYVHSLTALPLVVFGLIGATAAVRGHPHGRMIAVFLLSFMFMAAVYSLPEISAETAARHALFWFLGFMPFAAHGVHRTRVGLGKLAAAYRRDGLVPPRGRAAAPSRP